MTGVTFEEAASEFIRGVRGAVHEGRTNAWAEQYETWRYDGEILMMTASPQSLAWAGFTVPQESHGVVVFGQAAAMARDGAEPSTALFARCTVRKLVVLTPTLTELWAALDATPSNDWSAVRAVLGIAPYDAEVAQAAGWYDLRLSDSEYLALRAAARRAQGTYALDLLNAGVPVSEVIAHCDAPNPLPVEYVIAMAGGAA